MAVAQDGPQHVPRQAAELSQAAAPALVLNSLSSHRPSCRPPTPHPSNPQILTYLKVEPVQWPAARLRRVLNAAIASPISAQAG